MEAVRAVTESSRPISSVAWELGVNAETLRVWVNRARHADRKTQGVVASDDAHYATVACVARPTRTHFRDSNPDQPLKESSNE